MKSAIDFDMICAMPCSRYDYIYSVRARQGRRVMLSVSHFLDVLQSRLLDFYFLLDFYINTSGFKIALLQKFSALLKVSRDGQSSQAFITFKMS